MQCRAFETSLQFPLFPTPPVNYPHLSPAIEYPTSQSVCPWQTSATPAQTSTPGRRPLLLQGYLHRRYNASWYCQQYNRQLWAQVLDQPPRPNQTGLLPFLFLRGARFPSIWLVLLTANHHLPNL